YILAAANRRVHGQWVNALPSRFIEEVPQQSVEAINRLSDDTGIAATAGLEEARARYLSREPSFAARGPIIEGYAKPVQSRPRPATPFVVEDRVFHQKFGYGTVRETDNDKLTIAFDHSGEKRVMDSFVVPAKEAG
ncbi:MAG: DNA helicase II, partial [Pseudomonadota bacterium]